jgi:NAD(P)-dependent dehydrogenase (short-subunit alcohol dehydrogenase family)
LTQQLNEAGGQAHAIELDVRSYPDFERAVDEAVRHSGRIDYLFSNAGIGVAGEIDSYALEDWDDVFDVNVHGVVYGIQAVYPIMIRQRCGHIVNTASMSGLVATASQASYSATKHAIVAISKTLRLEAERHGVQVSVLCPGAVRTPAITGGKYGRTHRYRDEGLRDMAERGRPITPEKFAKRAIRAVLRGDAIIVIPAWWKAWWYLERLSPMLSMRFAKIVMLKPMRAIEANAS